jgi:hypothetical protein
VPETLAQSGVCADGLEFCGEAADDKVPAKERRIYVW